jgi:hypothetical protein
MRWSEDGFTHLLHLRLCWVNGRFDALFPGVPPTDSCALVNPYVLSVPSGPPHPEKLTGMDGMGDSVSSDGASGAAQEAGSTASQSDGSVYYDEDFDLEDGYSNLAETLYACVDPEDKDLVSYILRAVESDAYDDARDFARLYGGNGLLRILEQWIKNTEDR